MARHQRSKISADQEPLVLHTAGGEMPDVEAIERRSGRSSADLAGERAADVADSARRLVARPAVWWSLGALSAAVAAYFFFTSRRNKVGRDAYKGDEFFEVA